MLWVKIEQRYSPGVFLFGTETAPDQKRGVTDRFMPYGSAARSRFRTVKMPTRMDTAQVCASLSLTVLGEGVQRWHCTVLRENAAAGVV